MEAKEGMISGSNEAREGKAVIGVEEQSNYHVGATAENSTQVDGAPAVEPSPANLGMAGNKTRGRPRKYGPHGTAARALSPMPISSWFPPGTTGGDFSAEKKSRKRRSIGSEKKQQREVELENLGEYDAWSSGVDFTPHVITVNPGEDVAMKILSFSQLMPWAICIMNAAGSISNATLRRPSSSGDTSTYEGWFDIVSFSGSLIPTEIGGSGFDRAGAMSISLRGPDGPLLGGALGGLLIAASPVHVILSSFLLKRRHVLKPNNQKTRSKVTATKPGSAAPLHTSNVEKEDFDAKEQQNSAAQMPNIASPSSLTDNWATIQTMQDLRKSTTDANISLEGEKSDGPDQVPYYEVPQS